MAGELARARAELDAAIEHKKFAEKAYVEPLGENRRIGSAYVVSASHYMCNDHHLPEMKGQGALIR